MPNSRTKFGYKVPLVEIPLHHEQSDEAYGNWSASSTWKDPKFIEKDNTCPDVTSDYNFAEGTTAFLVWAIWTTGDSFGEHAGGNAEAIWLFETIDAARELENKLRKVPDMEPIKYTSLDKQKIHIRYGLPWSGYFEHLDEIRITPVIVK